MLKIGFLGAGNMAYALAGAVISKVPDAAIMPFDVNPERIKLFKTNFPGVKPVTAAEDLARECDIIFLAVKPQIMKEAAAPLKDFQGLCISIAAGLTIAFFENLLPQARIVRVMPNTPCLVGEMAAAYSAGSRATAKDIALTDKLLNAAGLAVQVEEEMLDIVCGLSGSGPAFFARLAEAFAEAAAELGLLPELALKLSVQTMKGTAAMLQETGMTPAELVTMVSSPNGTTVAGRAVLESSGYKNIISETVRKSFERSKELGK